MIKHPSKESKYIIFTDPAIKDYSDSAQKTIERWMSSGLTKEEAIKKWEGITFHKLPEVIRNTIKEK